MWPEGPGRRYVACLRNMALIKYQIWMTSLSKIMEVQKSYIFVLIETNFFLAKQLCLWNKRRASTFQHSLLSFTIINRRQWKYCLPFEAKAATIFLGKPKQKENHTTDKGDHSTPSSLAKQMITKIMITIMMGIMKITTKRIYI